MKLSRIDFIPLLAIVAGGVIGASLSFGLLSRSASGDVPSTEWSSEIIGVPVPTADKIEVEEPQGFWWIVSGRQVESGPILKDAADRVNTQEREYTYSRVIRDKIFVLPTDVSRVR